VIYLPGLSASILSLIYVRRASQTFYLDIDSLLIVTFLTIVIVIVILKRERVEKSLLNIGELMQVIADKED
jgi:hypothetical protein